ncbi:hypothetical protein L596_015950 [Steinernema carpocapsae]|uniref:Fungal lipase-type domain-containing protein n=1 Tax=Steinernema carpocapsae TaxID=34508 RepID=A0A4U5NGN4_STECR|nr:hypothetical protein L596_015950 [Steinernema carpocapsae]
MRVLAIIFVLGLSAVKSEFYGSYDETFAEQMLNMAAAAHGHRSEVIAKCLEKTYPGRQWLVQRNTSVPCDSKQNLCRGFVAVSHLDMKLLISFRGTEGFKQFLEEIESTLTEMVFYNNVVGFGSVVRYFYNAANQIYDPLDIPLFIQWYPNYEIWITGHSLGGALATLTALKVVTSGQVSKDQVKLVTFGMPRIGDYHFARHLRFHIPNMFRVVHGSDPVAHAPACGRANDVCTANCPRLDHFPFHAPQEIWYYNLTKEMYPGNYKLCPNGQDAGEDPTCSNSVECLKRIGHAASMHLNYFNHFIPDYGRDGCVDFASGHSISAFLVAVSALLTFASIR